MVGNTIAAARIAASAKPAGVVRTVALTDTALPSAREMSAPFISSEFDVPHSRIGSQLRDGD